MVSRALIFFFFLLGIAGWAIRLLVLRKHDELPVEKKGLFDGRQTKQSKGFLFFSFISLVLCHIKSLSNSYLEHIKGDTPNRIIKQIQRYKFVLKIYIWSCLIFTYYHIWVKSFVISWVWLLIWPYYWTSLVNFGYWRRFCKLWPNH